MSKIRLAAVFSLACLLSGAATALTAPSSFAEEPKRTAVLESEIDKSITLIGRLGKPLGTKMEVRGTWHRPSGASKDTSPRFVVTHVDSKPLENPIEYYGALVNTLTREGINAKPRDGIDPPLIGKTWTMRAYEWGEYGKKPKEFLIENGQRPAGAPVWSRGFITHLEGVVLHIERDRQKAPAG